MFGCNINMKKLLKNKYFLTGFITPLILVGILLYIGWSAIKYVENRDRQNFNDGYEVGRFDQLNESATEKEKEQQQAVIEHKKAVLNKLAFLESSNGKFRKILDTNNKYSLGLYHFQATTVVDMYWRYYKKRITIDQAVEIAYDDNLATQLAWDAIFIKGEKYHWHNSMIKLQKQGLIAYK